MKLCNTCGKKKPLSAFNRRGGGHQAACRVCQKHWYRSNKEQHLANVRRRTAEYRKEVSAFLADFKATVGCADCGEKDPVVLEFDHLSDKLGNVSQLANRGWSLKRIETEIAKCEVVCANCHRRRGHRRRHAIPSGGSSC